MTNLQPIDELALQVETDQISDDETAKELKRIGKTEDDLMDALDRREWLK